jgi:hypothetical protein
LQSKGPPPRPPSPPRGLTDIFGSEQLSNEFKDYLKILDDENENATLRTFLDFVLKCQELRTSKSKKSILTQMSTDFFNPNNRSKRLALRNNVLREECQKALAKPEPEDKCLDLLWKAEEAVSKELDTHHQDFLVERKKNSNNSIKACLL